MTHETETETSSFALARVETAAPIIARSFDEARAMSAELAKSTSVLPLSLRSAPDVLAIVMTGAELGLPPMAALRGLYVLDGKPAMYVAAKLAVVRARGVMSVFREIESTNERATYEIGRRGEEPIRRSFTIDDAKTAQLVKAGGNYAKSPAKMLRWRVIGELLDLIFPDVLLGIGDEFIGDTGPEPGFAAPPPAAAVVVAAAAADAGAAAKAERKKKKEEAAHAAAPASEPAPSPSGASGKAHAAAPAAPVAEQPKLSLVEPPKSEPVAEQPKPAAKTSSPAPSPSNADDGFGDVSEDERTAAKMSDALAAIDVTSPNADADLQAVRKEFASWSQTEGAKPFLPKLKDAYASVKAAIAKAGS